MGTFQKNIFFRASLLAAFSAIALSFSAPSSARIIEGVDMKAGAYPEVFAYSYDLDLAKTKSVLCTAVLIHPRVLLTSAHCLPDMKKILSLTNVVDTRGGEISLQSSIFYRHPTYVETHDEMVQTAYDFGLIILPAAVNGITPVKLASLNDVASRQIAFRNGMTAVGYGGKTNTEVDETTGVKRSAQTRAVEATDFVFSAAGPRSAISSGDSGGPAFIRDAAGATRMIGVASGTPNGITFQRTGLPDVSYYIGMRREAVCWIEKTANVSLPLLPASLECHPRAGIPELDESETL